MSPSPVTIDVLDLGRGDHLLDDPGEVFHDDDGLRPGILELMLQLSGGVERIAIDHGVAGPQRAEHRDRILQDVRHHQRDARASRQLQHALQIGREVARQALHLGIADRGSHVDECGARPEFRGARFEHLADAAIGRDIDVERNPGGISRKPDSLHRRLPVDATRLFVRFQVTRHVARDH